MSKHTSKTHLLPSLATPSRREYAEMDHALYRERQWYQDAQRIENDQHMKGAIKRGELVRVGDMKDIKPIARFQSSIEGFSPYLTAHALRAVKAFGGLWRIMLERESRIVDPSLRLALTSMVRTQEYQNTLVTSGRFASPDSTHCTGNAFDIDVSGYYSIEPNNHVISHVDPRRRKASKKIGSLIAEKMGHTFIDNIQCESYDPRITQAALRAAEIMYEEDSINMIHEFKDSPNACLHIAVNPDY
jgi:hypothetical protein